MTDERPTPPPAVPEDYGARPPESLGSFDVSVGPSNSAMEPPRSPEAYGTPDVPEGMMLTPDGLVACLDESGGQVNGAQDDGVEDEGWQLWEPCLAKHYDPPPQRWGVDGFFPHNEVSLFTGDGDLGKSTMLQQLQVAAALEENWLGMKPIEGNTLGIFCEDGEPQIWRRFKNALASHGAGWGDIDGKMYWAALRGSRVDTTLFHFDGDGGVTTGPGYELLTKAMDITKPSICILDSLHNFFPYSMIDTYLAKAFVDNLACLGQERGCTFIVNSHPSKTGIDEGTGRHGVMTWHNAVRARAYIKSKDRTDPDSPRIITHEKNQYGPKRKPFAVRYDLDLHVYVVDEEATEDAKRITGKAAIALDLLKKAIEEAGEIPPANRRTPANVRAVRTSLWKGYCEQGSITDSDKPDTQDKTFRRAATTLQNRGFIGVWSDWVWDART